MFRVKPSKPAGVLSTVVGIAMLGVGISQLHALHGSARLFLIGWCALVVVIGGVNAWSAFSRRGFTWQVLRGPGQQVVDADGNTVASDGTSLGGAPADPTRPVR